ncbi:uncharacterized protein LACBIDRAFT_301665 [Laccaria bicolor S238N-H82]|uniref:Predicted protein n=1 Tax=Laccaria bicolor (strain S238N-H82 / ATCC MYA-4686) TaxID=486041 RepID=B0CP08_LACBS|nr:uncharacterized protein LACBIDRAFT_301665 [Laccaria bicolor S238N-H82]EDR16030.1 predicted protein [Laccaria bicolor S238N-H82]|eukprot:XP_001874238.1 predicted protein [Laccaria bicolor S238N-H82]
MMSNQPKDSTLKLPSSRNNAARLRSPIPRSANDGAGVARSSSAPLIMTTPSSAIRAVDGGMAVTGDQAGHPPVTQPLQQPFPVLSDHLKSGPCISTPPLSNLPVADPVGNFYNKLLWSISDASSPCRSFN